MMVDIDRFKVVNDTHGHTAGDEVLRRVADTIVRTFPRRSDFVARYGGEEFLVVLQQDGLEVGAMLAERLLDAIRKLEIPFAGQSLEVTVSAGFAELVPGEDATRWIERADAALYRAKAEGRNRALPAAAEEEPALPSR
jgi:diguanylate cyclase (GGDEF)-like protein